MSSIPPRKPGAFLEAALPHARAGRLLVPLHHVLSSGTCSCKWRAECGTPGKHPRFHGEHLPNGILNATTDEATIRQWAEWWKFANVGIATGRRAGFWVLDIDPRHDGEHSLQLLEEQYGPLPHTWEALTAGGGRHLFFQQPDFDIHNVQDGKSPSAVGWTYAGRTVTWSAPGPPP